MKKYFFILIFFSVSFLTMNAQNGAFNSVPVVNGKVVFEQFIHTQSALSADQKYAALSEWGKNKYTGNPNLSGLRFDDRTRTMTVSMRSDLGIQERMTMSYRFDVSVTPAGCMIVIRDISYQRPQAGSIIPVTLSAEQTITDQAIAINDDDSTLRNNTRRATLAFFNGLFAEIERLFQ
ncbi:MAG: hypothetical protein LBI15_02005 [Dysgonamonadaceae bacterium]|jgi:hypothetical protein|nr:hypothetical protein [Dysgonamonadaceae bacterium]